MAETKPFVVTPREPNNTDAEAAIIGTCLGSPAAFDRLRGTIKASAFYEITYADTWAHMDDMAAHNRRADLVTLSPVLKDRRVGNVFAIDHLKDLVVFYGTQIKPDNAALDAYVAEVKRYAAQRFLAKTGRDLTTRALTNEPDLQNLASVAISEIDDVLDQADRPNTLATAGSFAARALATYMDPDASVAIPSGLRDLDDKTGGFYRGEMTILGGRPGSGKTTLAVQIALNAASSDVGTLLISLEMGGVSVAERLLTALAYNPHQRIQYDWFRKDKRLPRDQRNMTTSMWDAVCRAEARLQKMPFHIEEKPGLTVAEIGARVRRTRAEYERHGIDLAFVIVDYLGLIRPAETYKGQKVNEIGEISGGLKQLAKTLNVHILAIHQLNREVERDDDRRPQMHHLRDSGNLEQDADLILMAYREAYYLERQKFEDGSDNERQRRKRLREVANLMEMIIAKQRSGPIGAIECFCDIACNRISDTNPDN